MYIFLTLMYYTYAGLVAIVLAPSLQVSSVACTIFYALWNLFSGVLITLPQMPVRCCNGALLTSCADVLLTVQAARLRC